MCLTRARPPTAAPAAPRMFARMRISPSSPRRKRRTGLPGHVLYPGNDPFRMVADSTGAHIFVLDHDAPSGAGCSLVFGPSVTTCGDVFRLFGRPHHGAPELCPEFPGHCFQRIAAPLLSGPGRPHRLRAFGELLPHPQRHSCDRRFGLSLCLQCGERPADHQPEQLAAAWHHPGHRDRCGQQRHLCSR